MNAPERSPAAFRRAVPAMIVGRREDGDVPALGLGEPFALHGGDRLGPDSITWLMSHEWQPHLVQAVADACEGNLRDERAWFRMAPVVLVGPDSAGRTHAARAIARAAGVPHAILNVSDPVIAANVGAAGEVGEALWVTPVVAAMAATRCANPVVTVVGADEATGDVAAALAAMIDPATAGSFREDRLGVLVDLGEVTWIIQCRPQRQLPPALSGLATPIPLGAPSADPESLLGLSILLEALDDLGVDPDAAGLTWSGIMAGVSSRWRWRSPRAAYAEFRSALVEASYVAALGAGEESG